MARMTDPQDEVGRLRAENKALRKMVLDFGGIEPVFEEDADGTLDVVFAQTSPESADDVSQNDSCNTSTSHKFVSHAETQPQACKHPRIYTAQDGHRFCDECEVYLGPQVSRQRP